MEPGAQVREARRGLGWTQTELAERAGLSQAHISRIEQGQVEPSREVLRALGLSDSHAEEPPPPDPASPVPPPWKPAEPSHPSSLVVRLWRRPEASGDGFFTVGLAKEGTLIVAVDIAGHGLEQVPKVAYLHGWLRGYSSGLTVVPRIESFADDLERELNAVGLRAAWYAAILAPLPSSPTVQSYQGITHRFPAPLLLVGAPPHTLPSVGKGEEVARHELWSPWRLAIASDGLLRRLGRGDEQRGKSWLLEWQTSPARDQPVEERLGTRGHVVDDELYADASYQRWDGEARFLMTSSADLHRAKRVLKQALDLSDRRRSELLVAASEGLANVRRHAYDPGEGSGAPVTLRWRDERQRVRVEVCDAGRGVPPFHERKGFAVMRGLADAVDFRRVYPVGTVVTLVKNKDDTHEP